MTDSATGIGLNNAQVTLDLVPADGSPEYAAAGDLYGFYALSNVTAGTYVTLTQRGGYLPDQSTNVATAAALTIVTPLVAAAGGAGHELMVQV